MGSPPVIGFIGFGEAASSIAKGLHGSGIVRIFGYDINTHTPRLGEKIRERSQESGITLLESSADLAREATILLSTVTADQTEAAALQTKPWLDKHHLYADLNSVSPALKQRIAQIVGDRGAAFVEGAIMAPVPGHGHKVPILLGGPHAAAFKQFLEPYGMRLEIVSEQIGTAAATKMFRSIVVKGLEALIVECILGASKYEATERVFASLAETFPGFDWNRLADYMTGRAIVHGERRAREMEEVAATLRSIGIEPLMAEATARRQDWCAQLGIAAQFGKDGPRSYREVLDAITEQSLRNRRGTIGSGSDTLVSRDIGAAHHIAGDVD